MPTASAGWRSWAPSVLAVVWLGLVAAMAAAPVGNPDTWFHLALGRRFGTGGPSSLPARLDDPAGLSRFATAGWVPTQWSTQVLAWWVEQAGGLPALAWVFGALSVLAALAVYGACRSVAPPLAGVAPAGLAVLVAAPVLSPRPQVVSVLLVAVVLAAWWRTADDLRARWWLVPLTWVWATAHGLWTLGVLLGLVFAVGLVVDRRPGVRASLRLVAVPVASGVAALLTPVGPDLVTGPLAVAERASLIGEWQRTSLTDPVAAVALLLLVAVVACWLARRRTSVLEVALLLVAAALVVSSVRLVAFGALVAAPLLAAGLASLLPREGGERRRTALERTVLGAGVALCLAGLALAVPSTASEPDGVPLGLDARLDRLPAGSAVLVGDQVGSWLEWRHPRLDPVIDGLFDSYPLPWIERFVAARSVSPGWQRFVTGTGARVAVLPDDAPLVGGLVEQARWRRVAAADGYVLLRAR